MLAALAESTTTDRLGRERALLRDVADLLGTRSSSLSAARGLLLDAQLVDAPERGVLEPLLPGFFDYVRRAHPLAELPPRRRRRPDGGTLTP